MNLQIFLVGLGPSKKITLSDDTNVESLYSNVAESFGITSSSFYLTNDMHIIHEGPLSDYIKEDGCSIRINLRIMGGIDFQHREGSKIGSGGQLSESQAAIERRERLRKLALETTDLSKDPYFMRNHLGTFECKLCLTLHNNEGNYLAHTQGKRHQVNDYYISYCD